MVLTRLPGRVAGGLIATVAATSLVLVAAPAFAAGFDPTNTQPPFTFSGQAYAVGLQGVKILGSPVADGVLIGDSGQLPAAGGEVHSTPGTITLPGNLGSVTLVGSEATGNQSTGAAAAHVEVAGVSLLPNLPTAALGGLVNNVPLLGSTLSGLLGGSATNPGGLLSGLLGAHAQAAPVKTASGHACILGLLCLGGTPTPPAGGTPPPAGGTTPPADCGLLGLACLLGGTGTPGGGLVGGLLPDALLDVGLVSSNVATNAKGEHSENADIGLIRLLGTTIPITTGPNSNLNLGVVNITINQQAYTLSTNTSTAAAVIIDFPANGLLSALIQGTITLSRSTASVLGSPLPQTPNATVCAVTSISPSSGPAGGGTPVTITGTGFTAGETVTFGTKPATNVTFVSPTTITATTPAGAGSSTVTVGDATCTAFGTFTYRALMVRIGGRDRVGTAVLVSRQHYATPGSAGGVVLVRDDTFPDALAGVSLAGAKNAPLLLTHSAGGAPGLDPRVLAEVQRAVPAGGTAYLLGGSTALSPSIDTQLTHLGYHVTRIGGVNRFATAVAVAQLMGNPRTIFEATGLDFADVLSAGAAAILEKGAILLTNGSVQSSETAAYLAAHPGVSRFAVGGPAVAADPGAIPIFGTDRYATSAKVADFFVPQPSVVGLARGDLFPDALDGGTQVAAAGGPIVLTPRQSVSAFTTAYLVKHLGTLSTSVVYGGTVAVEPAVFAALATVLNAITSVVSSGGL